MFKKNIIFIKNCSFFDGIKIEFKSLIIEYGVIKKIYNFEFYQLYNLYKGFKVKVIDAKGLLVCPGFVDLHTHLREPGFSYKETIKTGTEAAICGGYTCVCSMPNLNPVPDSYENLMLQISLIKKNAKCEVIPFMSMTKYRKGKEICDFNSVFEKNSKLFVGITDDGDSIENEFLMEDICKTAIKNDILISQHCEIKKKYPNKKSEFELLERDLKIVEKYNCRYHMQHVSCLESVQLLRVAKNKGLRISCEVTPHHLLLSKKEDSGAFKMSPPIRSEKDTKALLDAILDGTIDIIATDHAPHSESEKKVCYNKSLNGIVGLETAFSLVYTYLKEFMPIEKILCLFTKNPNDIIKRKSILEEGDCANLTIIDLNKEWIVKGEKFFSKSKLTPFDLKKVYGKIVMVVIKGDIVFEGGAMIN